MRRTVAYSVPADQIQAVRDRLMRHATAGDCWVWTGAVSTNGYGAFNLSGTTRPVHRVSYLAFRATFIPHEWEIDHTCHNPLCINPEHLRAVTRKQNAEHRQGAQANSRSGVQGVSRHRDGGWSGEVWHHKKKRSRYFGLNGYGSDEAALAAAEAWVLAVRLELFTHNDQDRSTP